MSLSGDVANWPSPVASQQSGQLQPQYDVAHIWGRAICIPKNATLVSIPKFPTSGILVFALQQSSKLTKLLQLSLFSLTIEISKNCHVYYV